MVELSNSLTEDLNTFHAFQISTGYFTTSRILIKLTLLDDGKLISVEQVEKSQKGRKTFKLCEVHQVVINPVDQNTQGKSLIRLKQASFQFKDKSIELFTCFIEKPALQKFQQAVRSTSELDERVHMFFIKQSKPPSKNLNNLAYMKQRSYRTPQQSNFIQLQSFVMHTDDGRRGIQYSVAVKQLEQTQKKVIIVYQAEMDALIMIQIKGTNEVYELVSWSTADEWDSHRVQVTLSQKQSWLLDFQSAFKSFQFQEQLKIYQTAQIYQRQTQLLNTEIVTYVEIPVRMLVVTFNMARKHQDINFNVLFPNPSNYSLMIWGAQECQMSEKELQVNLLRAYLGDEFVQVGFKEMWEMFVVVFVKKSEAKFISNVQGRYFATGVMNYVGNKGGLLIQFNFFQRSFSVLNCHLPSGVDNLEKRMDHLANILRNIGSSKNQQDKIEPDATADFSVILGDLNSRFKSTYSKHIANVQQSWQMIESLDELHEAIHHRQHFYGYHEEKIHFNPTYKRSSHDNDNYINKKEQCPSYTDRILIKASQEEFQTQFNAYASNEAILGSDHRPVYLDMSFNIRSHHLMEPKQLLDVLYADQGYGKLKQKFVSLRFSSKSLNGLKKQLTYPVHLQMQFRATWLCESPFSYEKRIQSAGDNFQIKFWKEKQLPVLLTPVNSWSVLQNKQMLIIIKIREAQSTNQEYFAYCNIRMQGQTQTNDDQNQSLTFSSPIIGFNKVLGHLDTSIEYKFTKHEIPLERSTINDEADCFDSDDENPHNTGQNYEQADFAHFY